MSGIVPIATGGGTIDKLHFDACSKCRVGESVAA